METIAIKLQRGNYVKHPEWSKNIAVYELNVRQFTQQGTFKAAESHLPRLNDLGVGAIWLMPIYPIGEVERKGTLGSYYSIKNYKEVNPEFGTLADFKSFVTNAQSLGIRVIIDWVANHTSRDAAWVDEHPEWYKRDGEGRIIAPYDWTDVAQLDTFSHAMWEGMADAMKYWLNETTIDGFRCDMASLLPVDFWKFIRMELDKVRPVFMLAESEDYLLHKAAFDATYAWELHHIMNGLAQGKNSVEDLDHYFRKQQSLFAEKDMRLVFTSNHDENSWCGTEFERMGLAAKQMAVFSFIVPSLPLIYNGQEVALSHRLSFFEKDNIEWNVNRDYEELYKKLTALKTGNRCLWNAEWGGKFYYSFSSSQKTFTVTREADDEVVAAIFNFSDSVAEATTPPFESTDYFEGSIHGASRKLKIQPWQYMIFVK